MVAKHNNPGQLELFENMVERKDIPLDVVSPSIKNITISPAIQAVLKSVAKQLHELDGTKTS